MIRHLGRFFRGGDSLDGGFEEDGGSCAVDVVVAVYKDGFAAGYCNLDACDCGGHAEQQVRRVEIVDGGIEEALWVGDVPDSEQPGD